jgi:hypothetical protein
VDKPGNSPAVKNEPVLTKGATPVPFRRKLKVVLRKQTNPSPDVANLNLSLQSK